MMINGVLINIFLKHCPKLVQEENRKTALCSNSITASSMQRAIKQATNCLFTFFVKRCPRPWTIAFSMQHDTIQAACCSHSLLRRIVISIPLEPPL